MTQHTIHCAEEQAKISAAVLAAEAKTSGEVVVVIVPRSDGYSGARWRLAIAGLLLASAILLFAPLPTLHPSRVAFVLLQLVGLIGGYALSYVAPLLRMMAGRALLADEVHQRALQAFFENNLSRTRERTGVLLYISLLEHRVEVLADAGINAKVAAGTWESVVTDLVTQIRDGRIVDGVCVAVTRCGELLAQHFPRRADDANELPNAPVVGK